MLDEVKPQMRGRSWRAIQRHLTSVIDKTAHPDHGYYFHILSPEMFISLFLFLSLSSFSSAEGPPPFFFSLCSCYHLFAAQPNPEFRQLLIIGHPATSMPGKSHQSPKNDYRYYLSWSRSTWNTRRSSLLEKNPDNLEDQWETLSPKRPPSGTPCLAHERAGCVQRCFVGEHLEVSLDLPRNYIFRYCIFRYVKVDGTMRPTVYYFHHLWVAPIE